MSDKPNTERLDVYLDLLSNQPINAQARENFRQMLREGLEGRLEQSVDRIWELPAIILQQPNSDYVLLLREARALFVSGYFYSCVAMCGIVAERLIKDTVRASVYVDQTGQLQRPTEAAFDQLERVETSGLTRFLREAGLLSAEASKAADALGQLRNGYAHARGKNPPKDALDAIKLLHILVEGTVSVFKDFTIKDGNFVRRERPAPPK